MVVTWEPGRVQWKEQPFDSKGFVLDAGKKIRAIREQLGLTVRDVEAFSGIIAEKRKNRAYLVPLSRLFEIENKDVVPSAYRFYSLAAIYRRDIRELMSWYGIEVNELASDMTLAKVPNTHLANHTDFACTSKMPVRMREGFDLQITASLGPLIEEWGFVPLTYLAQFSSRKHSYGYIGMDDYTMYPILPPGSFIQIDESKDKIVEGSWRSEYDRPIYFVETRSGYRCCWCSTQNGYVTLQPHPLSAEPIQTLRSGEVEIIGQVVGVAMRLLDRSKSSLK